MISAVFLCTGSSRSLRADCVCICTIKLGLVLTAWIIGIRFLLSEFFTVAIALNVRLAVYRVGQHVRRVGLKLF